MAGVELYKRGQGSAARWVSGIALLAFAVFGCYELRDTLSGRTPWKLFGFAIDPSYLFTGVVFLLCALGAVWVVNSRRSVDFLIETEAKLRKVSWPTRAALRQQTIVVLVTVFLVAGVILLADLLFSHVMQYIGIL